jgi:hypothetical protein
MSSIPTVTPLLPGWWQLVQRAPMTSAYTLVKVGASTSHVTVRDSVVVVAQPGALGETLSVMVTVAGVAGQVNTGAELVASLSDPAVAVQAKDGATEPAEALAASATVAPTEVSVGDAESELMFAQICVVTETEAAPASGAPPEQYIVTGTAVVTPGAMAKLAEPAQVVPPSVDVAVTEIV